MESFLGMSTDQLLQIAVFIVILAVAWIILKAVLKIAMRVFTFGCGAILIFGMILVFLRYLGGN